MARPKNKMELLQESQKEYELLNILLDSIPEKKWTLPGVMGDWSIKDILAHLYEWQRMFFIWYEAGLRGEMPQTPAEGFKWNQLPALNQKIYQEYRNIPLLDVQNIIHTSHQKVMQLIGSLSETQLFSPGPYSWTKSSTLESYITANTGRHYRWARTGIRRGLKK